MFIHTLAEPSDIIDENTKFGFNDHIKLAKKIIDLPFDTETTIAKLMQLDQVLVDPLTQGEVINLLNSINRDGFFNMSTFLQVIIYAVAIVLIGILIFSLLK